MRVKEIGISNFKGWQDACFKPDRFACLVGENNAGKSSILQSLVYALGRQPQIPIDLFYDQDVPVKFRLALDGIDDGDLSRLAGEVRSKIEPLISEGTLVLVCIYPPHQKMELKVERLVPVDERYQDEFIKDNFKGKQGDAVRKTLVEVYPEFADDAPEKPNITQAREHVAGKVAQLPAEQFEIQEGPLPSGISASIAELLPEPIYIPAVKNLSDDFKTSQTTSFGRLLGLLLDDMSPDLANIKSSLEELNKFFNRVEDDDGVIDQRHARVRELEETVEGFLKENFPAVKVELSVPPPELRTILNAAKLFVDDGSKDLVENKGDGIRRSLTFALLQCWVEKRLSQIAGNLDGAPSPRPLVFLFEEPELYLHPKSQKILFRTLTKISENYQVVVTTHSPLFFEPGVTATFVRVSKMAALPKPIGTLHPVTFASDAASAEAFRLARFENADAAFFSQCVVLFEGESDDAYFKQVSKSLNPEWDFETRNIALVRVNGKGNFAKFRRFFEAFGITVKIIADLDAFFEGFEHLGANDDVIPLRAVAIHGVDAQIAALGIRAEPSPRQIKDKVNRQSWRERWDQAKETLQQLKPGDAINEKTTNLIDGLFNWEQDIARVRACREDEQARRALITPLDAMRLQGICVLIRGAIEDYYPAGAPTDGPKPERAVVAAGLVANRDAALALSSPIDAGRQPELVEICEAVFSNP